MVTETDQENRSKSNILVVDDIKTSRDGMISILKGLGYECEGCGSGEEALGILDKKSFTACILDQNLRKGPGQWSGIETLQQITRKHPDTRVIVFTALDTDRASEVMKEGASFYLRKTEGPKLLAPLVDALIKMYQRDADFLFNKSRKDYLQTILDAVPAEVMVRDSDHNVLYANECKLTIFGRKLDEVVGKKCYEIFEDKTKPCDDCPTRNIKTCRRIGPVEWSFEKMGKVQLITGTYTEDVNGYARIVEVAIDITRRKKMQDLLRELQKRAMTSPKAVVEHVEKSLYDMGYAVVQFQYPHYSEKSQKFPDITGTSPESSHTVELATDDDKIGMLHVANSSEPLTHEDKKLMDFLGIAVADAIGNAQEFEWWKGLREIDKKLTEASRPMEIFQAISDTLRSLLQANSTCVLFRDGTGDSLKHVVVTGDLRNIKLPEHTGNIGVIAHCIEKKETIEVQDGLENEGFAEYYNSLSGESEYKEHKEYVHDHPVLLVVPIRCGEDVAGVCAAHFKERPFYLTKRAKEFVEDIAIRSAIAMTKLEERRRLEAAIDKAKLNELGFLGAGFAHSIRTPLALAMTAIANAQNKLSSAPDEAQEKLELVQKTLSDLDSQIKRLSQWVRSQGNQPKQIDVATQISELYDLVKERFNENQIVFKIEIDNQVKPAFISPDLFKTMILDLLRNAERAMPQGGILTVMAQNLPDRPAVKLQINDTGYGMHQEQLDRLLNPHRSDPLPSGGTGLGLYLVQKSVNAAYGEFSGSSEPNRGTTFTIILPTKEMNHV